MLKKALARVGDPHGLLLVMLAISWLVGIVLSSWLMLPAVYLLISTLLLLLASVLWWRRPTIRNIALSLLFLSLGAWRYTLVAPANDAHTVSALIGQKGLEFQGDVAEEPTLENNSTLLLVDVQSVSPDQGQDWRTVDGEIQVQMSGSTFDDPYSPHYGDTIQFTGTLSGPPTNGTPELLASMAFPGIFIESQGGNPLLVWLYGLRTTLAGILLQALPQPYAALMIALFLSLRTPALKPLIPLFNVTNTAHLIAPSGLKITLLAGLIGNSTRWLKPGEAELHSHLLPAQRRQGNWRHWLHTCLVLVAIVIYTFLNGGGPAALRAGIMGIFLVVAPRLGRTYNIYTALGLTALLMSLANPFMLWDVGFQLSFSGTLGIVLFTPYFQRRCHFLTHLPLGEHVAEVIAVTLAAELGTLPIFALSFQQISFIAPLANILSVPLLGILLGLGGLICLGGLLWSQLAILCGWLAWPLLWFVCAAISWCAHLPVAYVQVNNLNPGVAWIYYVLLVGITTCAFARQQSSASPAPAKQATRLSRRTRYILQGSLALLMLLATAAMARAAQPDGRLTITLLSSGNPAMGQALLLHSPDGQTALIDEGADSTTLTQTLDTRLPFWQRTLNLLVLTATDANDLDGMQDVINRYQVTRIIDGGMLHPSTAYALWRRTMDERNLPYSQVRQGDTISFGQQVTFQVLWPQTELHKGSNEERDNALILRILAPGMHMLLLNASTLSAYALENLPLTVAPGYLQGQIVQISAAEGATFPPTLADLLMLAHPSLLLVTNIATKKGTPNSQNSLLPPGSWKVLDAGQLENLEIQSNAAGWSILQQK